MSEDNKKGKWMNKALEEVSFKDLIGMIWCTKGRFLTSIGMRYRKAKPHEMENVVNWATRETLKLDAQRFQEQKDRRTLRRTK